jgi:alkanesulfonate monooxygenase SsuD/methylene tetrahydromethanopterin reductase-like flavin-dependent oxidoreductase (luciferase family)
VVALTLGLQLPTYDCEDGSPVRWPRLRGLALTAEAVGVDALWVADHFHYHRDGERCVGFWEAWTVLSAIGEATSSVQLGPLVLCTLLREPALVAKMAATLDEISGGRLVLAVGSGAPRSRLQRLEFAEFGFPEDHLVGRFAEAIQIITTLLRKGHIDFHGIYHRPVRCALTPVGPTLGGPAVWVGASGPRMLRLAAEWGDAVAVNEPCVDRVKVVAALARVDSACQEAGRDPATLGRTGYAFVSFARSSADLTGRRALAVRGDPDEIARRLLAFHQAGMDHIQCVVDDGAQYAPPRFWPTLTERGVERFAAVVEALRRMDAR